MAFKPAKQTDAYKAFKKATKSREKEVKKSRKKKQDDLYSVPGDTSDLG